ncbi:hypothetical protein [Deinococcus apachensis]|uniref:hypothetical protein n=1 Tax=Deinococcus apachensis TaxID=309886 RepID=UPI00036ABC9C|nr:hypothetical protein [Deinococcus apachensis]
MLSEKFFLTLELVGPYEWRDFTFSLPLNEDRTGVRGRAGDHLLLGVPSHLNEDQFFACQPVVPLTTETTLAECTPLTFADQILPECVKREGRDGVTGLRCFAGPPVALGRPPKV